MRSLLKTLPPDTQRVATLINLARYLEGSEFQMRLDYLREAMHLADSLQDIHKLAAAKSMYASTQNFLGAYQVALEEVIASIALYQQVHDSNGVAKCLSMLGLVQCQLREYDRSIATLRRSANLYHTIGDLKGELSSMHNLAVTYVVMGDSAAAKRQYLSNLAKLQGTDFHRNFAATYNNLGNLFSPIHESDSAIFYYRRALEYKRMAKVPDSASIGNSLLNIASVYLDQGQYELALQTANEGKPYIEASQQKLRLKEMHDTMGKLFFKMGRFRESAIHYQAKADMLDSLFDPQVSEQASRLQAAYDSENQKREIESLNQAKLLDEAEKQRWRWISAGIALALLVITTLLVLVFLRSRERVRMLQLIQQNGEEIKRQQQEIVLQNEALSIQNKRLADLNEEKDGLIGIVAHDIRAPLNRSAALANLILEHGHLSPEQERFLGLIKKVSDDGGKLIQDLLDLNSYEQGGKQLELTRLDLRQVLQHACQAVASGAEQKQIAIHVTADEALALTDERLVGRILDNLISNAVKFTPKGKAVHLGIRTEGNMHWITIRDEGPGISPADQAKMFQKFQRLSARPTGGESSTGLGLSIVQALVLRIGAQLKFESELGVGTTFMLGISAIG